MSTYTTKAGTEIVELNGEEYAEHLENEVRASLGIGVEEFRAAVRSGSVDWDDPEAFYVAGLLGINGAGG